MGEWKEYRLGDLFERVTRKNTNMESKNVLTISAQHGLINQEEFFNKSVAGKNLANYYLMKKGEFAYNKSYSAGYPMGATKMLEKYDEGIVSTLYICFKSKSDLVYNQYFKYFFESKQYYDELARIVQEGARNHGLLNISIEDFFNLKINIPEIEEQKKTVEILRKIDNIIKKHEKIIIYNKKNLHYILKYINDNTISKKKLSDCCECYDKNRKPVSTRNRINGNIPYYGANGIQDYVNDYIFDGEFILLAEDGGHYNDYRNNSIAQYITGKSWVNNHAHILKSKLSCNNKFIYYMLYHKDIRKYIKGAGRDKLNQSDMWNIEIPFPSIKEQLEYSRILDYYEEYINKTNKKKMLYEKLKKGLMQQLLTGKIKVKI